MENLRYVVRYRNVVLGDPRDDDIFICIGNEDHTLIPDDQIGYNVGLKCVSCLHKRYLGQKTLERIRREVDEWDMSNGYS